MSTIQVRGELLAAADNTLTYRLLPYGEPGRTSKGLVTASKGSVAVPEDLAKAKVFANLEHDPKQPVARFTSVTESDDGLTATLKPLDTQRGRDHYVEATEGARTGISVEIDNPVIRNGALLSGDLVGAGFTSTPAYPSAQLVASDTGDLPEGFGAEITVDGVTYIRKPATNTEQDETVAPTDEEGTMSETPAVAATAPGTTLTATAPVGVPVQVNERMSDETLFARLNAAQAAGDLAERDRLLTAAVDQAVLADVSPVTGQGTWLGETFARRDYPQKYVPLFSTQDLTGMKATGWRFDNDGTRDQVPEVGAYTGYTAEPTSTVVKTKAVSLTAARLAGYNEYDRAVDDFPGDFPGFWEGFFREQQRSLDQQLDTTALAHMVTAANYTAITATDLPATPAQDLATVYAILDGIQAVQDIAAPDFAVIPAAQWKTLVVQREQDRFANLNINIQIDPAQAAIEGGILVVPSADSTFTASAGNGGKVLVGCKSQHTIWAPKKFRAQLVNVANGGNTVGLFAYYAMLTRDPRAFALVTIENDAS